MVAIVINHEKVVVVECNEFPNVVSSEMIRTKIKLDNNRQQRRQQNAPTRSCGLMDRPTDERSHFIAASNGTAFCFDFATKLLLHLLLHLGLSWRDIQSSSIALVNSHVKTNQDEITR
jgi:hypothetical protein